MLGSLKQSYEGIHAVSWLQLIRGADCQVRLVYWLCHFQGERDLALITHALVTSSLDYYNTLYVGLPLKTVQNCYCR